MSEKVDQVLELLAPVKVRSWLESLPGAEVVGRANHSHDCPLHYYLAHHGIPGVKIGNECFLSSFEVDGERHALPDWAEQYAIDLDSDEVAPYGTDENDRLEYYQPQITAALALETLDETIAYLTEEGVL